MSSKYFWKSTLRGLNRIGDVFIPQNDDLPSFSQYGGAEAVDSMVAYLPEEDITLLNLVLTLFSVLPTGALRWIVRWMEESLDRPGAIADLLRQLNLGLRGILFGCYYSGVGGASFQGNQPMEAIGYNIQRITE